MANKNLNNDLCSNLMPGYLKIFNPNFGWLHIPSDEIIDIKKSGNNECLVVYKKGDESIYPHTHIAHQCPHFSNFIQ